MTKEWVKDAWNEARVEANLSTEADKALGALRARRSVEAGLKNAQDQAKDQRKKLYHIEIELATQKQLA